jgi:hypothetical protein
MVFVAFGDADLPLEITKKNRLVFLNHCENFYLLSPTAGRSNFFCKDAVSPLPQTTTSRNNVLLRNFQNRKIENITAADTLFGKNRFLFRRRNQNFGKIPLRR